MKYQVVIKEPSELPIAVMAKSTRLDVDTYVEAQALFCRHLLNFFVANYPSTTVHHFDTVVMPECQVSRGEPGHGSVLERYEDGEFSLELVTVNK